MSAGDGGVLHLPGDSALHRLAPQIKLLAAFGVVLCVVATPRAAFWAFGGFALLLGALAAVARIPPGWLARRLLIELPFVVLALVLPFALGGERTEVAGLALSVPGLLAAWNILAKGTLGLFCSLTLAATTSPRELLLGLQRLRTPTTLIMISSLMLRYVGVVIGEAGRMRLARISRGDSPRFLWQANATARGVGTLFLRCYERGERVHLAMVARGWSGELPEPNEPRQVTRGQEVRNWLLGLSPAATSAVIAGVAVWTS
ncbi:cobalt/nickel transport system permease protein [Actinopolyspora alba]|uniref:Cobalt/nickel transport system permease protein n=1 Tax=Actinopolyspora alba TaxID=673379 RepID=A0A1I1TCK4_9ACTN|nr:cobalt ECF transporter T component CbiQ [Actinopolyspora alba]SFD56325.1 cobalt/nickel transport system permease protein [Actinopolyspora alba]